jgi:hypothetical protein
LQQPRTIRLAAGEIEEKNGRLGVETSRGWFDLHRIESYDHHLCR